jgi:hypothetical protein
MRCRRVHNRAGARVELGAVTRTHDEIDGGGITDCAPGMGTDRVVGDKAALGELKDEARVTRLRIGETRGTAYRHLAGLANRSPGRRRRGRSHRPLSRRGRARAQSTRRSRARWGKRDALVPRALCAPYDPPQSGRRTSRDSRRDSRGAPENNGPAIDRVETSLQDGAAAPRWVA